jgi:integrase
MPATQVSLVPKVRKDGRTYYALRYQVDGVRKSESLGAISEEAAEQKRAHLLADIQRGRWEPLSSSSDATEHTTFRQFAEEWWTLNEGEWRPKTKLDYKWRLDYHLQPFFGDKPLGAITYNTVERFKAAKLKEESATGRPFTPRSVNMFLTLLGQILESAAEQELIPRNPAKGKKRRVKERAPARSYLESAGQIEALLDAAGELDRKAQGGQGAHIERRAALATLTFAGLRIGELLALRWKDVDLAGGWLHTGSKTDAGRRKVKIRGALRDELLAVRGRRQEALQSAFVFPTSTGARTRAENFRKRVLKPAVMLADKRRAGVDLPPLPGRLTPHSLRRTFCSLLYALGETPPVMGHTDAKLALNVYAQVMRRDEDEKAALAALVEGRPTPSVVREAAADGVQGHRVA